MDTMRAARFEQGSRTLTVTDVPVPVPGPMEVLVRVQACGICLSDVHLIDGSLPGFLPVITPGHEAAGVIKALGEQVQGWRVGQRVAMTGGKPCFGCANCVRGRMDQCLEFKIMGFAYDGAWAEYIAVPSFTLTPVPDHVPIEQAAILADAVSTPYAGLIDRAGLKPGETVGLWGIGGLGVHAVQIARMAGAARIIAVDPNEAARERALAMGADHALDPSTQDVQSEVMRLTSGLGLDLAVDLYGANAVLAQGASCLGRFGRLLMVGLSFEPLHLGPGVVLGVQSQSILGHLGYSKRHLDELMDLIASGRLDVSGSISDVLALEDVGRGVERLARKEGNPIRLVVKPELG